MQSPPFYLDEQVAVGAALLQSGTAGDAHWDCMLIQHVCGRSVHIPSYVRLITAVELSTVTAAQPKITRVHKARGDPGSSTACMGK